MVPMGVVISVMLLFEHVQVNLYTGALFIQQSLGWDLYLSILLQIGIVAVLTITGAATAIHPSVHVSIHLSVSPSIHLSNLYIQGRPSPPRPMMPIAHFPYFRKMYKVPLFPRNL